MTSQRHVYVAIPLYEVERESPTSNTKEVHQSTHRLNKLLYFLVGSVIGIGFSVSGFYVQDFFHFGNIVWYSLGWSCFTSLAAYFMFYCCMKPKSEGDQLSSNRRMLSLEYFFALGVFLGFCVACTVTDLLLGMPARSIVLTVAVAALWALLMAYCGSVEEDDEDEEVIKHPKHCKGTVLPMMIV